MFTVCCDGRTEPRMKPCLILAFIAALQHWEVHSDLLAEVQIVTGAPRIFSGEKVVLRCVVDQDFYPDIRWFRGPELLYEAQELTLWEAKLDQAGSYYCQGFMKIPSTTLYTNNSQPFHLDVDGGWVILEAPPPLVLVGDDLEVKCRLRGNQVPKHVILYRDGQEVLKREGPDAVALNLTNLTLQDTGSYHCRATWDTRGRSRAAESQPTRITVQEVLTEPTLQVNPNIPGFPPRKMQLVCQVEYNAHPPTPPLVHLFYWNGAIMRPATTENSIFVPTQPGDYSCRAKVPLLNIEKRSEITTV
uniref:Fc gamma receptor-like protein n=1 Tax=Plecoglossus altivelis TaxID=61084 RepID=A0A411DAV5_PLEAT|nr:Fc gamma receptor-like protein [Plecoglossus altivelis]